jgi:exosortase/archaeosortase family protein
MEPSKVTDEQPKAPPANDSKKQSIFFLIRFLVLVSFFFIGYRYAIDTRANMHYLHTIASQTSFVLQFFGHSSEIQVERHNYEPQKIRLSLQEWGVTDPDEAPPADPSEPLSTWEYWLYEAHSRLRQGKDLTHRGPTITFVAQRGLVYKVNELKESRSKLGSAKINEEKIKRLDDQIATLNAEITALSGDPDADKKLNDKKFDFQIVPDCGAIPSLAIYLAAVLAFPVAWKKRIVGSILGLIVLYCINIVRIAVLGLVGAYDTSLDRRTFEFVHEYIWQSIFLLFVVCVWIAWVELLVKTKPTPQS